MKNKAVLIAILSLLLASPVALAANNNGNNGNSNGNANSASSSQGKSQSNSNNNNNGNNNNNNANSAGNNGTAARNSGGQNASSSQGKSQSKSNNNNGANVNSKSNSNNGNNSDATEETLPIGGTMTLSIAEGQTISFGDNDANIIELTDEDFDEDMNDGTTFRISGIVEDLDTDDDTFAIGGKTFAIEDNQMDFLTSQGILDNGVKVQVNGNNSNNGNIVRIMKIMGPDGQMLMVRLHVNDQVSQFSVKSKNVGGADEGGFLSQITSFFQSFLGIGGSDDEDGDEDISPTPSPSPTPEVSPTP